MGATILLMFLSKVSFNGSRSSHINAGFIFVGSNQSSSVFFQHEHELTSIIAKQESHTWDFLFWGILPF